MTEITILSGKGGTGKTSITAALATVASNFVLCDCDVDAADMHLIMHPEIEEEFVFEGAYVAKIDNDKCTRCSICINNCRFDAISRNNGNFIVDQFKCEGCRLCERICPVNAINSKRSTNNFFYNSNTRVGQFVHASMGPGEENSGKLVTQVRNEAKAIARANSLDIIINDGPPGIGCPVISSVTGVDKVLFVIEPTKTGLHDAKRLADLLKDNRAKKFAIINKADLNHEVAGEVESWLKKVEIPLLAKLPFDSDMVEAMIHGKSIIEYKPESIISNLILNVWERIIEN
jgi:MinD superfamily P-loop ATPase